MISKKQLNILFLIPLISIILILSRIPIIRAQSFEIEMKMTSTPNPVGSGARALGTGGAYIAIADDATAASWNPGALLNLKRPEISIVGADFSGSRDYETTLIPGETDDLSRNRLRLNYFSTVFPFMLFQRNIVFSLNYQHLYEFSQDARYQGQDPALENMIRTSHRRQKGGLSTFSPALAVQVFPPHDFYFGITFNFWLDEHLENHWENYNIIQREGTFNNEELKTYTELYERYEFSGLDVFDFYSFNINMGFLWSPNRWFSLGGVIKTPFKAHIKLLHEKVSFVESPKNPIRNEYPVPESYTRDLTLEMPVSYGIGGSIRFSDKTSIALDIYWTHWEDFLLYDQSGKKTSPINNEEMDLADIKPTTQVRLGLEYLAYNEKIPLRTGIFYDPEPASRKVDDFYGLSAGLGFVFEDFTLDMAYQYRFGERTFYSFVRGEDISGNVREHYFYSSIVYFL